MGGQNLETCDILGIPITIEKKENIREYIKKYFFPNGKSPRQGTRKDEHPLIICTPNPEIIARASRDPVLKQIIRKAQINLPDGWGTSWAIARVHKRSVERISGIDFLVDVMEYSSKYAIPVGCLGGGKEVALKSKECLNRRYPKSQVHVVAYADAKIKVKERKGTKTLQNSIRFSVFDPNGDEISRTDYLDEILTSIRKQNIGILFVGLGCPKQEYVIGALQERMQEKKWERKTVLMALGGSFDVLSGRIPRAPKYMRNAGLEWAFRLIRQPTRIKRQLRTVKFFLDVMGSLRYSR